ncbi:amine oxidase [flavin-containing] A-like protein, partial [Dinothrombium tinctorium]
SGYYTLVLEAKDRIGGRICTKRGLKVNWVDLGASYIGSNQFNILRIAKQFEIKTYKVFSDGLSIDYVEVWSQQQIYFIFTFPGQKNGLRIGWLGI